MTRRQIPSVLVVFIAGTLAAAAAFSNADFSNGLSGWSTEGSVSTANGAAIISDSGATDSALYQPIAWPAASFTLEFDFRSDLSPTFSQGTLPDVAFASIYFTDDPQSFDPDNGGYDSSVSLFDFDAFGTYNLTGTISASDLGSEWSHYSVTLANSSTYIIPYFEVHDLNFQDADSSFQLDNFRLVPEPSTLSLAAAGAVAVLVRGRRRRTGAPRA